MKERIVILKFDIVIKEWNNTSEYRKLIALYILVLRYEIRRIGILPACQVVYPDGPVIMRLLINPVISVDIQRIIDTEIIRHAEGVPVRIQSTEGPRIIVLADRYCYRPPGTVRCIHGHTDPV